ncbi:MAG: enoyl-CoA hydratase, partial [Mycobacterium sp.]
MSEFVSVVFGEEVLTEGAALAEGAERVQIATLLLSRPPTNALTRQVCREIIEAAAHLATRDDICAVVVFGGHEIFSVGED